MSDVYRVRDRIEAREVAGRPYLSVDGSDLCITLTMSQVRRLWSDIGTMLQSQEVSPIYDQDAGSGCRRCGHAGVVHRDHQECWIAGCPCNLFLVR